ncbi:MAG: four helix bundle protein [Dysgonamonadaceae bacterium]|jgi:four helix bundle protein|nr:four helix bundle protein [Dysgonamonadaceae bacterium]
MKKNIVKEKSYAFALKTIKAYKFLSEQQRELVLPKQMLRSGTAIGALVREAGHAESKADFVHKMSIALKEANETTYWLMLLKNSEYINKNTFDSIFSDCSELAGLLVSIIKPAKSTK